MSTKVTFLLPEIPLESSVELTKLSAEYIQDADTNSDKDEIQTLYIETQRSGSDEDDFYFNIKTNKWSIDKMDELSDIIKDFKERLHLNIVKSKDIKQYEG